MTLQVILASASSARLHLLQAAGVAPIVHVSGVDESVVSGTDAAQVTQELATLKAEAVWRDLAPRADSIILGCDSVLAFDGEIHGKPELPEVARERWRRMRGRSGALVTGHHLIVTTAQGVRRVTDAASTTVYFADVSDAEIDAYVATGEPLGCAGAFTIDGLGAPFIERIEGDPHTVIGLSLPLVRRLLTGLGISWTSLWPAPRS